MADQSAILDKGSVNAVWSVLLGGRFRLRLTGKDRRPGHRWAEVLDGNGTVIGSAHDSIYGGRGRAVHTVPFGGFAPADQCDLE